MTDALETFTAQRAALFGIAYRMLGSVAEAEDMVQETYLRWRKQDPAAVGNAKAWLITATTRLCVDQLRSARQRREEYVGVWLPEPLVGETAPAPSEHAALADSLSLAFMLMLETLGPVERAVFLLREAFDLDYATIAGIVDRSEAACRQMVSRAKTQLARQPAPQTRPPAEAERLMREFMAATQTGKLPDLLALLSDDAVLYTDGGGRVLAAGRPIVSADRIARFFVGVRRRAETGEVRVEFATVNGAPGALRYVDGRLERVVAIEATGGRIARVYIVRNPEKLGRVRRTSGADWSDESDG